MYPQFDQRIQMPYGYPTFHIPSQKGVHPVRHFPAAYEPWSYGGNCGYRIPDGYNYFPAYHCSGYPHPYHPPPLPCFHDACCPTTFYSMHHPVHYAPPPNYSMELPTYDYDKKPNGRCPYHLCCRRGDKEKESDAEKRTDSFPPAQSKNLPYPIVWIPPEEVSTAKQMHGGFTEPGVINSSDQLRDSFKLENEKRVENLPNLDGSQFPFPILWIPYEPEEAGKKDHDEEKTTPTLTTGHQELSSLKPSRESADSNLAQATTMVGKNDLNHCKSIPVKQLDEPGNNHTVSKQPENELAKNNPEGGYKRSKLPPVCLRIEPIPKKNNGSGKSRSVSPPKRGKPEELVTESSETKGLKEDMKLAGEHEHSKLAQVADAKTDQAKMPSAGKEVGNSEAMDSKDLCMDTQVVEVVKRKELTEVEAALIIQAAYRGYEVRKWEPIKKLKEIDKVKEELNEVKSRMKAMEFSSYSSSDKDRSLLGEMIMNLLLKLDTIQGLDPVTRDVRKSTAKELVNLQEQVDSLVNNKREDVNSAQMEMKAAGSENVKVFEGEIGATKEEEKEAIADDGGVIELEAIKKEGKEEDTSPQMEMKAAGNKEVKGFEGGIGATKEEEDEEKEVIAIEETVEGDDDGVVDLEATEKEEEGKEEVTALEEAAKSADNGGVTDHVAAAKKEEEEEDKEEVAKSADNEGWATSTTIFNSGEMLELKEVKGLVDMEMNEMKHALMGEADKNGASDHEDSTMMTSTNSGLDTWGKEEKQVEALMVDADNGGASDHEGLGEDTCIITSTNSGTKVELKEEEKEEEERVRMMMEKLVEKGKEQLEVIRELSERVVMLEKRLVTATKKKKAGARTRTKTGTRKCNLK